MGLAIWVVVDRPSFFDIIDQADDVCNKAESQDSCDQVTSSLGLYGSAPYVMMTAAACVIVVSFFGKDGKSVKVFSCVSSYYKGKH